MEKLFGIPMDGLARFLLVTVGLILAALAVLGWRNRVMVRLGLRNIPRRRAQTAMIVFGLMLSTLIISAAFGTGDTMSFSLRSFVLDEMGEEDERIYAGGERDFFFAPSTLTYFRASLFASLADQIAQRQAKGDPDAGHIEALTPVIQESAPVINLTGRQSEPRINVIGHDPQTADAFDELFTVDGERVTVADLKAGEVYLNEDAATDLLAEPGHELEIYLGETPINATVKAVIQVGGLPGQLIMPLDKAQAAAGRPGQINTILVTNVGGPHSGAKHSTPVANLLRELLKDTELKVRRTKQFSLAQVELLGSAFTTIFIGFGSFSIAAGLLLIFLIFVMLAAERKQEMGMARAVGTRRRHLIQMFVFEGTTYDLAAAAVGALLGVGVGLATVGVLAAGFESLEEGFALRHHIEPRSLIVAYCLGVLLTFLTVAISSWRVSQLNIVSAIRDLPPPPNPDAGLRALFVQPWRHLVDALRHLLRLRLHRSLKQLLWDGPLSTLSFFWALIGRGPLTVLLGFLALLGGLNSRSAFLFNLGVSLVLIGVGLIARWVMRVRRVRAETRDRIAFSFTGISLLVYWSLPFDALDFLGLPKLNAGPEMFVLSGVMMVAGAVWTIIYNSDLLLGLVTRLSSPFSNWVPVVRTAIAYPMSNKFRTGLTIAMFALIVFTLVFMSVFVHIFNQTFGMENLEELTQGFDIYAETSGANPIPDLEMALAATSELNAGDYEAIAGVARRFTEVRQTNGKRDWRSYSVRVVDQGYLAHMAAEIVLMADGYDSTQAVWEAVRENPGLAVIDGFGVPSRGSFSIIIGGEEFRVEGVYLEDERMEPIPVQVRDADTGTEFELKIIGVLDEGLLFMTGMGIFVSQETWQTATGQDAPPTEYFVRLADGVDAREIAQTLESTFLAHGLDATAIMAQIEEERGLNDSMVWLIQAFMGLGLVVGVAALGVISTRAVVERRHQIGVLRAIGYRPWMVRWSFLLESSFVAFLGIFIGIVLGLILAYNFYNGTLPEIGSDIELSFVIPWTRLGLIVAIAYGASLVTTYLPAWQAARVYPAEALRYE